ncbi:MAG: hypothetical protein WCA28_19815 [Bradyrhizobium sp.]
MNKAVMSMVFNTPRMARYLSEIGLTSLAQGYAIASEHRTLVLAHRNEAHWRTGDGE